MKIAIVDDTLANLLIVRKHVETLGHTAVTARDGLEAVSVFERERPDLVLMDVMMPEVDGYESARRIRALEGQDNWTPIIFLTGMGTEADLKRGIEAGGDDYLIKPVSAVVLAAKIKAMQRLHDMRSTLVETTRKLDLANQELQLLSARDGLTGIANRRAFAEAVLVEWNRNARAASAISLAMLDIDCFKQFNDHYGHLAGDECLRRVATALQGTLKRPGDLLARYGGEEFVAILPATPLSGGIAIAEELCEAIRAMALPHAASAAGSIVTVSIGVATIVPDHGSTPELLIKAADEMLYKSKRAGRNQVQGTICGAGATITRLSREAA
jgi:diguanylate cyclase (GGDEF)-like protein